MISAHSAPLFCFPAAFEAALSSFRFAAVSSPFISGYFLFLSHFPGQEVALAPQWQWGKGGESAHGGGSQYRALLVAQPSAFK